MMIFCRRIPGRQPTHSRLSLRFGFWWWWWCLLWIFNNQEPEVTRVRLKLLADPLDEGVIHFRSIVSLQIDCILPKIIVGSSGCTTVRATAWAAATVSDSVSREELLLLSCRRVLPDIIRNINPVHENGSPSKSHEHQLRASRNLFIPHVCRQTAFNVSSLSLTFQSGVLSQSVSLTGDSPWFKRHATKSPESSRHPFQTPATLPARACVQILWSESRPC